MNLLTKLFSLESKVALVTGAARGNGLAIAKALGGAGASVIGVDRLPEQLKAAAQENRFEPIISDLSDTDAQTYSSTDMFNRQDYPKKKVRKIKNQLRKKTPKKKKEDRIVDKSLLLSARLRKKSV